MNAINNYPKLTSLNVGDPISNIRLIGTAFSIRTTSTGKPYLAATFSDGKDVISGNIWNYKLPTTPPANKVYEITGAIEEYMNKKQLRIADCSLSKEQDMTHFCLVYDAFVDNTLQKIFSMIETIKNLYLRKIVVLTYTRHLNLFAVASSAKLIHHVGIGGNVCHCYETACIAHTLAEQINALKYETVVNTDLVIAGALLHDIGKAWTYSQDVVSVNFTQEGMLLDHIAIGIRELTMMINSIPATPEEYKGLTAAGELLMHVIASHHGTYEHGSPVVPKCLEALCVSIADGVSASTDTILQANSKAEAEGRTTTEKLFTQGNVEFLLQSTVSSILGSMPQAPKPADDDEYDEES